MADADGRSYNDQLSTDEPHRPAAQALRRAHGLHRSWIAAARTTPHGPGSCTRNRDPSRPRLCVRGGVTAGAWRGSSHGG
uniref:Uncharacterized protein n=1 Tax=Knipowitschia caucasica TaxID=637954 RepID=A0AAV2KRH8_KNICA